MKRISMTMLLMLASMSVSANGDLRDLIAELQHIKHMVAQQEKAAESARQRMVFRYDLVEQRIDVLIDDIEKHLALLSVQPRSQLIDERRGP